MMLRDRYYIGYVTYQDEEFKGRHEPLISDELFEAVQDIIETRATAQERRRVHHHYLKGSLYCGRCRQADVISRMIIQHTVNSRGTAYTYFFCRGKQSPHINVIHVEDAVEAHYATVRFDPGFVADVRAHVAKALEDEEAATRLLHRQLTPELRSLDTKEANLIDLVADGDETIPQAKIKQKLRDIEAAPAPPGAPRRD